MAGNKNSGRKKKQVRSVEYRFMMPGQIDQALVDRAREVGVEKKSLLKKIIADNLGVEYY